MHKFILILQYIMVALNKNKALVLKGPIKRDCFTFVRKDVFIFITARERSDLGSLDVVSLHSQVVRPQGFAGERPKETSKDFECSCSARIKGEIDFMI